MKKVALVFSSDYEIFGDGSGNVNREQIQPTNKLVDIISPYGAKLTIMFEYAQYCTYEKFSNVNSDFKRANKRIEEQLIELVKNGHDVQLHYHAQWRDATYKDQQFKLNLEKVDISCLKYNEIVQVLRDGKQFLETLLKPHKPDYKCIAFRAGSWAVKNEKKLAKALQECGFKLDSSVVPNAKFESEHVNFEYHNSPYQYHYWHCNDDLSTNVPGGALIELPIYTKKSPFAAFKYLNKKYAKSRKVVKALYTQKISEVNFSLYEKIKKVVTRDYYMADINTMDYKTLISMVEDVLLNDKSNRKVIPLMFIAHSKVSYHLEDLKLFFMYLEKNYPNKIEYWTLQETVKNIENGLNSNTEIITTSNVNDIQPFLDVLPILGTPEYLKTKSSEYGWFISRNFILPYYIDTKGPFSRMVFSTNIVTIEKDQTKKEKKLFLDSVISYTKEKKLCDFIYKAQSNVVFDVCPKESTCIPWGTYEVDLSQSNEELFNSFNAKARNAIRKALKEGVSVFDTQDAMLVYENIKQTLQRQSSVHYPSLQYIKTLQQLNDSVVFLAAKYKEQVQGTLILVYDKHRGYAMYAGSIQKPITGSLDLLHYEAMKFLQSKNIPIYDFVGTRLNIKKGSKQEGVDRFKRKFNPQLQEGFAFRTVIRAYKFYMYFVISKFYFKLHGSNYIDPITNILIEEKAHKQCFLFIGPRNNVHKPETTGGVIVLFENLLSYCDTYNVQYISIDTNKANYKNKLFAYIFILYQIVISIKKVKHVSLHGTANDYLYVAPFALIVSKIYGKHFSLRKFAGNFIELFEKYSYVKKSIVKGILKYSDVSFFETKYLVYYFSQFNEKTFWFPNVRHKAKCIVNKSYEKKFIFLGSISKEKGINVLCQAVSELSHEYQFDIYGKLYDNYTFEYLQKYNINYKGELNHENVISTLLAYDVLILPSFREGYPGVIIEALSVGMPVIAAELDGIKEMIDNTSSVLFEVGNVSGLKKAIESFNEKKYNSMSRNALKQFEQFDSEVQTKKYLETILQ